MIQIKTDVQGLSFVQSDIFGCYLPSLSSIEYVLSQFKDKRKKREFCSLSNSRVMEFSQGCELPIPIHRFNLAKYTEFYENAKQRDTWSNMSIADINKGIVISIAAKCYLAEYSLESIIQSFFTVAWFDTLLYNNYSNVQKVRKNATSILVIASTLSKNKFLENGAIPRNSLSIQSLSKEYTDARSYYQVFQDKCCQMMLYNPKMLHHELAFQELIKKKTESIERINNKSITVLCEGGCGRYFKIDRLNSSKICNSCKKRSAEQKKVSRRIDRYGWVSVGTGKCAGGCGSLKIKIDTSGSCLTCYLSTL